VSRAFDQETERHAGNANGMPRSTRSHQHAKQCHSMAFSHHCLHKGADWHEKQNSQMSSQLFSTKIDFRLINAKNCVLSAYQK
jgi:hypothetical protein